MGIILVILTNLFSTWFRQVTKATIRNAVAFVLIVYLVGLVTGMLVLRTANLALLQLSIFIPLFLLLLSYIYLEVAIVLFVIFILLVVALGGFPVLLSIFI